MRLKDLVHRSALRNRAAGESVVGLPVGMDYRVFEVTGLTIPEGTDFTEPMEIGTFTLTNEQMIVNGLVTMRYVVGDTYEPISIFVAPVARKTPSKSGYLHAGAYSAGPPGIFIPPSVNGAAQGFGYFHLQDPVPGTPDKVFDNPVEQQAIAGLSADVPLDAPVDFGVYLSPLSDTNPDNTTYQDITVETASVKLLII